MDSLQKMISYLENYVSAIEIGVTKFASSLPVLTQDQIRKEAKNKLNTTRDHFLDKVKVKMDDTVLIVELDRDDWLANAVESGVESFDMKPGLLNSPKAKISKKGFRYIRIPIGKKQGPIKNEPPTGPLSKSQEYQRRINEVLSNKPQYDVKKYKTRPDGKVYETQKVMTGDPWLQGFYRTRIYKDAQQLHDNKHHPKWEHVLFRTVSENPLAKGQWQHPGIKPAYILKATERWLINSMEDIIDGFIKSEIDSFHIRMASDFTKE